MTIEQVHGVGAGADGELGNNNPNKIDAPTKCHTLSHFLTGTNGTKQTFHKYFAKSNTKIIIITANNNIAPNPPNASPAPEPFIPPENLSF
jgi:hypothetical protein